jgi:hypothetical protein
MGRAAPDNVYLRFCAQAKRGRRVLSAASKREAKTDSAHGKAANNG